MIKLISHNESESNFEVEMNGSFYIISYYIDSDGCKCLSHNNGYCEGTSNLTVDYPDNDNYESDDELNKILSII